MDRRTFLALASTAPMSIIPALGKLLATKSPKVNLRLDDTALVEAFDEVLTYKSVKGFGKSLESFFDRPSDLLCIECGPTSKGACLVTLKPSQRLLDFLAAARAGKLKSFVFQGTHG